MTMRHAAQVMRLSWRRDPRLAGLSPLARLMLVRWAFKADAEGRFTLPSTDE